MGRLGRSVVMAVAVLAWAATAPRAVAGRGAGALFDGDREAQARLARGVVASTAGVGPGSFHTASRRFDGEWALVTQVAALLGLGQVALAHPELRGELLPAMERGAERLVSPEMTAFGAEAWGEDGMAHPESDHGHAYLGYVALGLGMMRRVDPGTRFAGPQPRLVEALARRLSAAPHGLVETYPGEAYPADVASILGAIGLLDRSSSSDHGALIERVARAFRDRWVDPASGLLYQRGDAARGAPRDAPRASGTALAAYFVSFADPALARELFAAVARSQRASFLGFGGIREVAPGQEGRADIDSGPVLFGVSVSATGFALAGARATGDRSLFTDLYRTAVLFGAPVDRRSGTRFLTGGPLGNALLLALMTTEPWS